MKISDGYGAKFRIWAMEGRAHGMPRIANLPSFGHRRFDSYAELNAWKQLLLGRLLKDGGARWTR